MHKNWLIINLNKKYFLKAGNKVFRCQIGTEGFENVAKKVEGDKTTPIGKWRLEKLYYRPDRILRPKPKKKNILKINQITKYCGWCDDIRSKYYNQYYNYNKINMKTHIGLSLAVMCLLYGDASAIVPSKNNNLAKVTDHSFLDTDIGAKVGNLGLSIFAKQNK